MSLAAAINTLAAFCGPRDWPSLSDASQPPVDVAVLFGGSIVAGGAVFAEAIKHQCAKRYVIVGGFGHTTQALFAQMQALYPSVPAAATEADLFANFLQAQYGLQVDWCERKSTNCGNNITNLLALLGAHHYQPRSFLLVQDATMQRRMAATLQKFAPEASIVNYAAYQVRVAENLTFIDPPLGMWPLRQYVALLCGEIARLRDSPSGYGPLGKGFIAHVTIPQAVCAAYQTVLAAFPDANRAADPAFASR
ncbi:ElyC/SanA/YdcF family protein [Lacticaseibacillus jixiensis]|uniref:ElyC/SanA/YdcF family protein n=1 Tax=Lacticaseibacillus jixiensis TaxID=3231926 RepID=UPI0036F40D98